VTPHGMSERLLFGAKLSILQLFYGDLNLHSMK